MDNSPEMIPMEEADYATLKHYAVTKHGIEIPHGANANTLRGKILAVEPDCKEVPKIKPGEALPSAREVAAAKVAAAGDEGDWAPIDPTNIMHYKNDPKVALKIDKTTDKTRAKIVTVSVSGDVWRMERGVEHVVPYRVFEALDHARENQAVETDEINPHTKMPMKEWQEVHSYPFNVTRHANPKHVEQWRAATSDGFQGNLPQAA